MVKNAVRPPGFKTRLVALSTESLADSQHSTSVCTTASNDAARNGRSRADAVTDAMTASLAAAGGIGLAPQLYATLRKESA